MGVIPTPGAGNTVAALAQTISLGPDVIASLGSLASGSAVTSYMVRTEEAMQRYMGVIGLAWSGRAKHKLCRSIQFFRAGHQVVLPV